jgi:hypothetical protein
MGANGAEGREIRSMKSPEERQLEFWESVVIVAISAIITADNECTIAEAVEMATECADGLLNQWRDRVTKIPTS